VTTGTQSEWSRVLVYGLGLSGRSALDLLRRRGVEVVAVDRRQRGELALSTSTAEDPGVEWMFGEEPERVPAGVEAVVLSPGVPLDRPLLADAQRCGIPVLAEVELAYRFLAGEVVAITGSNGKSTTTALTGALLRACGHEVEVCGNIGVPLSGCVDGPPGRVFVVELSSFQLETISTLRPRAAALLNLSPDHLDRYRDLDSYAAAKARIFSRQGRGDVAVLNADDERAARIELPPAVRRRLFSRLRAVEDGCYVDGRGVVEVAPGEEGLELFAAEDVPLPGPHNLENAMAASLLARAIGAEPRVLRSGLATFVGLPHRLERVAEVAGVVYYDDSKGTNVAATERSLEGFADGSVHLILGGRHKGGDLGALRPAVARKARALYLIGEAVAELERALRGAAPFHRVETLERAVRAAAQAAAAGEVVLLSPACASFDQFRSFVERGERFRALVRELGTRGEGASDG
jgi:UDP-N-acetylmuramoylalanine--D-glutamate ligase